MRSIYPYNIIACLIIYNRILYRTIPIVKQLDSGWPRSSSVLFTHRHISHCAPRIMLLSEEASQHEMQSSGISFHSILMLYNGAASFYSRMQRRQGVENMILFTSILIWYLHFMYRVFLCMHRTYLKMRAELKITAASFLIHCMNRQQFTKPKKKSSLFTEYFSIFFTMLIQQILWFL